MAMDKDKLIQYFLTHYTSRQEVLYKLPLSISIDTFWPELMNRRKAGSCVLSLYNHSGKPYWYVLTDKMIAASERLCEEAMNQDDRFDPYRMTLTRAMTEEMFFTSFVEGAQIPLHAAMDFLGRGTEPEDIQEQMIWNNCQAWSAMVKALYKPLDETFVKSLAFMLTDEMEGRADDYRQTDDHHIAAMHSEPYEVPSASLLPERMQEYYGFLQSPNIHPLIKAAVGQAFLLAARPFPEGNERLSRMISSAVLLRSGYDFLRDISVSSLIARENYRYYKAMREILQPENGSDLTYFIEYYLDLLARALDAKRDTEKQREDGQNKETLEKERQMAKQPLGTEPSMLMSPMTAPEAQNKALPLPLEQQTIHANESPPISGCHVTEMRNRVHQLLLSFSTIATDRKERIEKTLASFLLQGIRTFTREEWQTATNIEQGTAQDDCGYMLKNGILTKRKNGYFSVYTLTEKIIKCSGKNEPVKSYAPIRQALNDLQQTGTDREKRIAEQILELLNQDIIQFSYADWCAYTGLSKSVNQDDLRTAVNHGFIEQTNHGYRICACIDLEKRFQMQTPLIRDVASKLLVCFADRPFSSTDAVSQLNGKPSSIAYCLEQLAQKGIVYQEKVAHRQFRYTFTKDYLARQQMPSAPAYSNASVSAGKYTGAAAAAACAAPSMQL